MENYFYYNILTTGGTIDNYDSDLDSYLSLLVYNDNPITLLSSFDITPTTPVDEGSFFIRWEADVDLNGNFVTICGVNIPQGYVNSPGTFSCYYNTALIVPTWQVQYFKDEIQNPSATWYSGAVPPVTLYNDNDLYLDTVTGNVYKQIANAWVPQLSLIGPQGPQGPQGPAGPQGVQGIQGLQGLQGIQGNPGETIIRNANNFYVFGSNDPVSNGDELLLAYDFCKLSTPNFNPLSIDNRITIMVAPGHYELSTQLILDTPFIDIISLSGQKDIVLILTGGGNPLSVQTDNINLTGINTDTEDFIVSNSYVNINIINSGNNKYTITRSATKNIKTINFVSDNPNEYDVPGGVTIFTDDYTQNPYRYTTVNISGSIKLLNSPIGAVFSGAGGYSQFDQPLLPAIPLVINGTYSLTYNTLVGTLNVGDTLILYDAGFTIVATGIILFDDTINSELYFKLQSGTSFTGIVSLLTNPAGATAVVGTPPLNPYGIYPSNPLPGFTPTYYGPPPVGFNVTLTDSLDPYGISTINLEGYPFGTEACDAFVQFYDGITGNPLSFFGDTTITNDLLGTATINYDPYSGFLYLTNLTGTWDGATTITGNNTSNTESILQFSNSWQYTINIVTTNLLGAANFI